MPSRPGIRASLVAGTVKYAVSRGVSMQQITAQTGLCHADLREREGWLPEAVMPAVWRLLATACPGEVVALSMAVATPMVHFGPLAQVCRSSTDVRSALLSFIRYRYVLADSLHMELAEADEVTVRVHHPMDAEDGGLAAEMGIALGARVGRELLGIKSYFKRIEFSHAPWGPTQAYEDFFAVPVLFERSHNAMVFSPDTLELPTLSPNPALYRFMQSHLRLVRQRLAATFGTGDVLARVRRQIAANAERSEYSAEALAKQLGMSLRQLQRLARHHDTSVRALIEHAREEHARQLLSDSELSIEEVSFLLGYSDGRAFRRAFKRWTGKSPAQLRRALPVT